MDKKTKIFVEPKVEVIEINQNIDIIQTSGLSQTPLFGGTSAGSETYNDFYRD